jgi:hypothetical protein
VTLMDYVLRYPIGGHLLYEALYGNQPTCADNILRCVTRLCGDDDTNSAISMALLSGKQINLAYAAEYTYRTAESAEYATKSAEYAAKFAEHAAEYAAEYAARCAAEYAEYAAEYAEYAAEYAAKCAKYAAEYAATYAARCAAESERQRGPFLDVTKLFTNK